MEGVSQGAGKVKNSFGVLLFFRLKAAEDAEREGVWGASCQCAFARCRCREHRLYCVIPCRAHMGLHDRLMVELKNP